MGLHVVVNHLTNSGSLALCYCAVENLSSVWREFQAVQDLRGNDAFLPLILAASSHAERSRVLDKTRGSSIGSGAAVIRMPGVTDIFMEYLRAKFNPSQLRAIVDAADCAGFTLVQGRDCILLSITMGVVRSHPRALITL